MGCLVRDEVFGGICRNEVGCRLGGRGGTARRKRYKSLNNKARRVGHTHAEPTVPQPSGAELLALRSQP